MEPFLVGIGPANNDDAYFFGMDSIIDSPIALECRLHARIVIFLFGENIGKFQIGGFAIYGSTPTSYLAQLFSLEIVT